MNQIHGKKYIFYEVFHNDIQILTVTNHKTVFENDLEK